MLIIIVINTLVPNNIACEITYESNETTEVHAVEIRLIQNATKNRKLEFLRGRNNAHLAMKKLDFDSRQPILIGKNREPIWPDSIVGSITHCKGYCAVAVAFKKHVSAIGIDAELNTKLADSMISTTQTNLEIANNRKILNNIDEFCFNKLVFSAKESVFKFTHPFIQRYINFTDVELFFDLEARSFSVSFLEPELKSKFENSKLIGKFNYNKTHIVTCIYQLVIKNPLPEPR